MFILHCIAVRKIPSNSIYELCVKAAAAALTVDRIVKWVKLQ